MTDLVKLTNQYRDDVAALEAIEQTKRDALATLAELETSTDLDIDDAAQRSSDANLAIQNADFKLRALRKRIGTLRASLVDLINEAEYQYTYELKDSYSARREQVEALKNSAEFKRVIKRLKALYSSAKCHSFDSLLSEVMPHNVSMSESHALADELGMITSDPEPSEQLTGARHAIGYDQDDYPRGRMGYRAA